MDNAKISVADAAKIIGCTHGRVCQLVRSGAISGSKIGRRVWLVERIAAEKYAEITQKTGRPKIIAKKG